MPNIASLDSHMAFMIMAAGKQAMSSEYVKSSGQWFGVVIQVERLSGNDDVGYIKKNIK